MKKRLTKAMSVFLVCLMATSCVPLSGFVSFAANEFETVNELLYVRTDTDTRTSTDERTETDTRTETDVRSKTDIRTYTDIFVDEKTEMNSCEGKATYLRFIPAADGIYSIKSISDNGCDPYVKLYDEDGYMIDGDDDGLDNGHCDFILTSCLEKGSVYYFGVSSYEDGRFYVRLTADEINCDHINTERFNKAEATCAVPGYTAGTYCYDCKMWIKGHTEIPTLAHTDIDNNNICDECNSPIRNVLDSGSCGDTSSYVLYDDGKLVISGEGEILGSAFNEFNYGYYRRIKTVVIENGITEIGSWAFYWCDNLTSIVIAESVKNIGYAAFSLTNLKAVAIPEGVEEIIEATFAECWNLETVELPESIKAIGVDAFSGCESLTDIEIPENVTYIGERAFNGAGLTNVKIPAGVTNIDNGAFSYCDNLKGFSVSEENKNYCADENGILYNKDKSVLVQYPANSSAESFEIPEGVKSIGCFAFSACEKLKNVIIPDSVTSIGESAFRGFYSLTSIIIPDSVTSIGESAFEYCYSLTSVIIPDSVTNIDTRAFYGCGFTSVIISDSVTSIGERAFSECENLEEIEIPYSVKSIGDSAFCYCRSLKKIEIYNPKCVIYNNRDTIYYKATIYAAEDSMAHKYAKKYEREFVITCEHINAEVFKALEPSCTRAGSTEGLFCNDCGKWLKKTKSIEALGHNFTGEVKANNDATHSFKCVNGCGEYGAAVNCYGGVATCTKRSVCSVCEAEYGQILDHSFTNYVYNNDAKCGVDGTETAKCNVCTATDTRTATDTALKHKYVGKQTSAPSCTASGVMTYTCEYCTSSYTEDIDPTGHSFINYISNSDATCLSDGTKTAVCDRCTATDTITDEGSKLGHSFINYISNNDATCLSDGTKTAVCDRCTATDTITDEGSKLGHSFTNYVYNNDAKCGVDGTETAKCNVCTATDTRTATDTALKHKYVGKQTSAPSCTASGVMTYTCEYCTSSYTEDIDPTGHSFINYISNNDATCLSDGTKTAKCERCEVTDTISDTGSKLEHSYTGEVKANNDATHSFKCINGCGEYGAAVNCSGGKATCTEKAVCSECATAYGEALGHSYKTVTTKATLKANGKIDTKCSVCGKVSKTTAIYCPKTFTISATKYTYTGKAIKPTVTVRDSKGKKIAASNYTVSYSNNKKVGTGKVTIKFKGNYSGTKTLTFKIVPKQVTGLKASAVKTTSVKLTWSKTAGAKYYKIERSTDGKKWKAIATTSKTGYTVSKLKAGNKYRFRVTALDSTKKIAGQASKVLKTGTLTAAPKLTLKSSKSKTATASWKKVTGASKFVVYKSTNGKKWTKVATTTKTSYTLKKLTGGKKIYVKVTALNAYGKASAYSSKKKVSVKK